MNRGQTRRSLRPISNAIKLHNRVYTCLPDDCVVTPGELAVASNVIAVSVRVGHDVLYITQTVLSLPPADDFVDRLAQREHRLKLGRSFILKEYFFLPAQYLHEGRLKVGTHVLTENKCIGAVLMNLDLYVYFQGPVG